MIEINILYIHTHDTGRYIQPYGYSIPTPNLMALAQEGTLFRNAFCAGPTCSPSRAGLLTGMAPHSCGMLGLAHRGFQLDDYSKHLVNVLNDKGYDTVLCGIQHVAPNPEMIGYKKIPAQPKNNYESLVDWDVENASKTAEYLKNKKEGAFFLSFGMFNTHRVYPKADENLNPDYLMPPFTVYDNREAREDMAAFITSAVTVDRCVGTVLKALRESGREDETLVIFTTDHGIAWPKMKCTLYDTGIGISLIIKFKGNKMKGAVLDSLVSHLDIFPTICDLAGFNHPDWLQGKSLMPLFNDTADEVNNEIFSEVTFHAAYEPMRCIRTRRYKLIRYFGEYAGHISSNIDDSPSKRHLLKHGYLEKERDEEMLFDLYTDPMERINLSGDKSCDEIRKNLSSRLDKWMWDTGDPLSNGTVEKPVGAIVNTPRSINPGDKDYE